MAVKLRDVLELPNMSEIKMVAGATGLDRVVYWVHIVDLPDLINWVQGGELLFTTGIGIQNNLDQLPQIVRECFAKNVAGLVINIGPYIQKTPEKVISLADELGFPVFEVSWEVKLGEVTRGIYNLISSKNIEERSGQDILETILYGSTDNYDILVSRVASCHYDLTQFHQVMVIKFKNLTAYLRGAKVFSEQQILVVKLQIQNNVQSIFQRNDKKVLLLFRLDTIIILLPTLRNQQEQCKTRKIGEELLQEFKNQFAGLSLHIGWGNSYANIRDVKKSLSQSEQAIRVAQTLPGTDKCVGFDELGFYKVLFNVKDREELEDFRNEVLCTLLEYDQKHGAELVNTLSVFLEENDNFLCVSERLYIHRNTLKYRLQKVAEISGRNLNNSKDRMLLYFATIVHKFLSL
jgi:DNA-binding PucR family transcriptional regulator